MLKMKKPAELTKNKNSKQDNNNSIESEKVGATYNFCSFQAQCLKWTDGKF